jgi:hypothetical protein
MTKYIPDTWKQSAPAPVIWNAKGKVSHYQVSIVAGGRTICGGISSKADATLIAAAPDLLEALRGLLEATAPHNEGNDTVNYGLLDARDARLEALNVISRAVSTKEEDKS